MSNPKSHRPEWVPKNAGREFTTSIVKGTASKVHMTKKDISTAKRKTLTVPDYVDGVLENDRTILGRTVTLIESNSQQQHRTAQEVLNKLLPHTGKSLRIGITGIPGAGKSTFIESFGLYLIQKGHKVAVLTIDPSSSISKGSILGDKARMERLSRESNCFIRPSPSGGALGGVARKTRETMLVCEAAGYDVILVETIGVGQSEITVRSMVDFFVLILVAGAGDELQGIKKGVMELTDILLINKADGVNKAHAELTRSEYSRALHYLAPATKGWTTEARTYSALTGEGIPLLWQTIKQFKEVTTSSGIFEERRRNQLMEWFTAIIDERTRELFYSDPKTRSLLSHIRRQIQNKTISPTAAAELLLRKHYKNLG